MIDFLDRFDDSHRISTTKLPKIEGLLLVIELEENHFDIESLSGSNLYYYFDCREHSIKSVPSLQLAIIKKQLPRKMANWLLSVGNTDYVISNPESSWESDLEASNQNSDGSQICDSNGSSPSSSRRDIKAGPQESRNWQMNEFLLKVICHRRKRDGTIKLVMIPAKKFVISVPLNFWKYFKEFSCLNYGRDQKNIVMEYKKNYLTFRI